MSYEKTWIWYDPPKKIDSDELLKRTLERANDLNNSLEDFRSESWRYFALVDFKSYFPDKKGINKDSIEEENLLDKPYMALNVTGSCVETCASKIAKSKPRVTFQTDNADREKRELARKLDNWILKTFKKGKAWKHGSGAFKSCCVTGLGFLKVYIEKNRIKFRKIAVFDVFFDNAHEGYTEPKEMGEKKTMTLYDLIKMFPDKDKELKDHHGEQMDKSIVVYEIYRAYEVKRIFTENVMLLNEKWDKPLPYVLFKWEPAEAGVLSVGISKKIYYLQMAISYILGKTLASVKNFAVPRIFIPKGAQPTDSDISNVVGEIIEIDMEKGDKVQFSTPKAMDNQVIDIMNLLWQRAFEVIGISQMTAGGTVPRGLENASGTALRKYQEVESERFQLIRTSYEEGYISLAKKIIKMVPDSMLPKGISRSEVMEALYEITIWSSSILPDSPAGKLAMVSDIFNSGLAGRDQALSLLQSPDTNKFISSEVSRLKAVDISLDRALSKGEKPLYHKALGLDLYLDRARKLFAEMIVEGEVENEKKLNLLNSCIDELESKLQEQTKISDSLNRLTGGGQVQPTGQTEPLQSGAMVGT